MVNKFSTLAFGGIGGGTGMVPTVVTGERVMVVVGIWVVGGVVEMLGP